MARRLGILVGLIFLLSGNISAQTADARKTLEAAAKAMGVTNMKTLQYSASGWFSQIGQTYGLAEDWPHYEVTDYTRVIDFDARWSREDYTRRQGKYPTLGRVPMPEQHVTSILSGNYAWDMQGDVAGSAHADVPRRRAVLRPAADGNRADARGFREGGAGG